MKEIARSYFWWPRLYGQIEERVRTWPTCQKVHCLPQPAPLHPWDWPENPEQHIHNDFAGTFEERMFLVAVDAHSKLLEVSIMKSTTAEKTIEKLCEMFSRFGFPEQLMSDNEPQFVSKEFERFLKANGVQHIRSTPYHPSTNGLAERFVQSMKNALKASQGQGTLHQHLKSFLLSYRNVAHSTTNFAPAVLLLKRQLWTNFDLLQPPKTLSLRNNKPRWRDAIKEQRKGFSSQVIMCWHVTSAMDQNGFRLITQTGPGSYTLKTMEDTVLRRHADQLLSGATASVSIPKMTPAEPFKQVSPAPPTHIASCVDPVSPGPTTPVVSQTELSPSSTLTSVPVIVTMDLPDGSAVRRYPQREQTV